MNIGEVLDSWVPEELSEEDKVEGRWWRQLLAGGGAGAGKSHPLLIERQCIAQCYSLSVQDMYSSSGQTQDLFSGMFHFLTHPVISVLISEDVV